MFSLYLAQGCANLGLKLANAFGVEIGALPVSKVYGRIPRRLGHALLVLNPLPNGRVGGRGLGEVARAVVEPEVLLLQRGIDELNLDAAIRAVASLVAR